MQVETKSPAEHAIDHPAGPSLTAPPTGTSRQAFRESLAAAERVNRHHADRPDEDAPQSGPDY